MRSIKTRFESLGLGLVRVSIRFYLWACRDDLARTAGLYSISSMVQYEFLPPVELSWLNTQFRGAPLIATLLGRPAVPPPPAAGGVCRSCSIRFSDVDGLTCGCNIALSGACRICGHQRRRHPSSCYQS